MLECARYLCLMCIFELNESGHQIYSRCKMSVYSACTNAAIASTNKIAQNALHVCVCARFVQSKLSADSAVQCIIHAKYMETQQPVTCLQAHLKRFSRFYSEIDCIIFVQPNSFVNSVHQIEQIFNEFNEISRYLFGFAWFSIFTRCLSN